MGVADALAEFLRSRRASLQPVDVGLPEGTRRRVPGLRREEVALLAGISPEYYVRLEQGRDLNPSDHVLDSIGRALRLDADEYRYLVGLARPERDQRRRPRQPERVSSEVQDLIDSWSMTPAYVIGLSLTVLASNALARALSPFFSPGVNTLAALFCEPGMRDLYVDWDETTAKVVAHLRAASAGVTADPRTAQAVEDLNQRSDRFRTLWAKCDVRQKASGVSRLRHPHIGVLELRYEKLALGTPHQTLVAYHAAPGSQSEDSLRLLTSPAGAETVPG